MLAEASARRAPYVAYLAGPERPIPSSPTAINIGACSVVPNRTSRSAAASGSEGLVAVNRVLPGALSDVRQIAVSALMVSNRRRCGVARRFGAETTDRQEDRSASLLAATIVPAVVVTTIDLSAIGRLDGSNRWIRINCLSIPLAVIVDRSGIISIFGVLRRASPEEISSPSETDSSETWGARTSAKFCRSNPPPSKGVRRSSPPPPSRLVFAGNRRRAGNVVGSIATRTEP